MKILVTGGAGFIASHIVDLYIKEGHTVSVVDNLCMGSKKNLNSQATFYETDIRDQAKLEEIFAKEKPEIVNHHAALASVTASVNDPSATFDINVQGTINLLEIGAKHGLKKFIFASTGGALYGEYLDHNFTENDPALPISPYGQSKLQAEKEILARAKKLGVTYTIFRYANAFGPRQNPHGEAGIIAIFCNLIRQGKAPTMYSTDTTRDYVYVGDIALANLLALTKGAGEIYNLGTGVRTPNQKIFDTIAKIYGFSGQPNLQPLRPGELHHSVLSATKAERDLGWQPTINLETGIKLIHAFQN